MTALLADHPCYSTEAHSQFGRMHLPVAPRCNIQCAYCVRKFDCPNENRPGVTTRVLTADEAMDRVTSALAAEPRIRVLGIAGPGDALANDRTFEVVRRARQRFGQLTLCLSTNGLLLLDRLDEVVDAGVTALTITINAVDPEVGRHIYTRVRYRGVTYTRREAFELLSRHQLEGLRQAVRRGIVVKVNSVLIPGINDDHLVDVARLVKALGAHVHNVIPVIPMGALAHVREPGDDEVALVRARCGEQIGQFEHCRRCRADAIGVLGEEECGSRTHVPEGGVRA